MALRVVPLNTPPPPSWIPSPKHYNSNISAFGFLRTGGGDKRRRENKVSYAYVSGVRTGTAIRSLPPSSSSVDTSGGPVVAVQVGQVTEVTKDTFWPLVKAAGDKTVVLDMYTQWCGPCKVIAPRFQELSKKYLDVVFLKLDCNQENRPLAKELGIKVVPTFKILKDSKIVKEVTGAKFDDLVVAIDGVRSS